MGSGTLDSGLLFGFLFQGDAGMLVATHSDILGMPSSHSQGIATDSSTCRSISDRLCGVALCPTNPCGYRPMHKTDEFCYCRNRSSVVATACTPLVEPVLQLVPPPSLAVSSKFSLLSPPPLPIVSAAVVEFLLVPPSPPLPSFATFELLCSIPIVRIV